MANLTTAQTNLHQQFCESLANVQLERADDCATKLRANILPETGTAVAFRGEVAAQLATTYFAQGEYTRAEAWALRAMQTQPRVDALCLLGELALLSDNVEGALAWYAAGEILAHCTGGFIWETIARRHKQLQTRFFTLYPQQRPIRAQTTHGLVLMTVQDRETFAATAESIAANGIWQGPTTVIIDGDGPQPTCLRDWTWLPTATPKREGQARTFFRALEHAHMLKWDFLTVLEDDIVLAPNALEALQHIEIPANAAVLAWYSNAPQPFHSIGNQSRIVMQQMPCAATGVALTMTRRTIDQLLTSEVYNAWTDTHGGDGIFNLAMPGKFWATMYPNPVQHIGTVSLTGNSGARQSPSYPHCTDARTLFTK